MVGILKYRWCVVVEIGFSEYHRGQILSKHETYDSALEEIEKNPFLTIKHITDLSNCIHSFTRV